jgi:uncharacterized protein (TIGR03382 family)
MDGQDFVVPPTGNDSTEGMPNVVKDLIEDIQGPPLPGAPRPYQQDITLPDTACDNCTLQLIQIMTDNNTYDPAVDVYYQCADITLVANNAPDAGMNAAPDAGTDQGSGNNGGGEISSGCSTGNATGLLALVGLLGLRRRRR